LIAFQLNAVRRFGEDINAFTQRRISQNETWKLSEKDSFGVGRSVSSDDKWHYLRDAAGQIAL
jgi:hypothetical protein